MSTEKDLFRLGHIIDCCEKITELVNLLGSFELLVQDWIKQDAMIRNFEIIGEASHHISDKTKEKYKDVAWDLMRGMRNIISHEYFGIDLDNIWDTATNDIPILKTRIETIISDLEIHGKPDEV